MRFSQYAQFIIPSLSISRGNPLINIALGDFYDNKYLFIYVISAFAFSVLIATLIMYFSYRQIINDIELK